MLVVNPLRKNIFQLEEKDITFNPWFAGIVENLLRKDITKLTALQENTMESISIEE